MRNETKQWLKYGKENLESAKILYKSHLYNPCLQNVQQCVEKTLKSAVIERSFQLKRTHSIVELKNILFEKGFKFGLSDEDCEFLDSIYLPSKYPLGSALPYFEPDDELCKTALEIAESVYSEIMNLLAK